MRKQQKKSGRNLKTTSNTQDVAEMLSEAVLKAQNDILNEVLKSLQRCGNGFTEGIGDSCKSFGAGAVNYIKVTSKIQVNYK